MSNTEKILRIYKKTGGRKTCKNCREEFSILDFYYIPARGGFASYCKDCETRRRSDCKIAPYKTKAQKEKRRIEYAVHLGIALMPGTCSTCGSNFQPNDPEAYIEYLPGDLIIRRVCGTCKEQATEPDPWGWDDV